MINRQNEYLIPSLEQLALFHFEQAKYFERLKMASVNSPALFYHYAAQQFYNQALEHQYKVMLVHVMIPRTTMVGANEHNNTQSTTINPALLTSLREGGYILYARHGEALVGEDQPNLNLQDCSTQRNLSEVGRKQAVTYGEALRSFRIPVKYPVLASPFCRTRETAELAFGADNVQVDPFLFEIYTLSGNLSSLEQNKVIESLHSLLEIQPPPRSNQVIIAHSFPKGLGLGQIPDMGSVVVKPHGPGKGYEVIGQLSL
ncbi:MAG: histidine phosphatase family protein, partial [Paenisporosarcina sp.]|nr:histidine phosphatase family protein [Paenisporosarcina sp.]